MTAVAIAGMHRSGTSMIAKALRICGLYLGEERDFVPPGPDNPEGFWEHARFLGLNDRILAAFGGAWDLIPDLPANWALSPRLLPEREAARQLIQELSIQRTWGWKDPRSSLTLQFWKEIVPDLRIVLVVRNPIEVWRSLARRGYSSFAFSAHLTQRYFESLLAESPEDRLVVTHFHAFFTQPAAELRRLAAFLDLRTGEREMEAACAQIRPSLRHTASTLTDLLSTHASQALVNEYVLLCRRAGPSYEPTLARELQESYPEGSSEATLSHWYSVSKVGARRNTERPSDLSADGELLHLRDLVRRRDVQISRLSRELNEIRRTKGWRFLQTLRQIRRTLIGSPSR